MIRAFIVAALVCAGALPSRALAQTPRCPNILITFDVSGSMQEPVGFSGSRYSVGRNAIRSLLSTPTSFRYGLELFGDVAPNSGSISQSTPPRAACAVSSPTCNYPTADAGQATCNSVQSNVGTTDAINSVLSALRDANVAGSTPTAAAISVAATRADMKDTKRARYVLLVTDGDPLQCVAQNDPAVDMAATETAIQQLANDGIKTFVIGFAGGSPANLNRMAVAGGTARRPAGQCGTSTNSLCYYDAADGPALEAALNAIIGLVGGEFGGGCDDSCYAQKDECSAGQICKNATCQPDPCAGVTCAGGSVCVEGQCQSNCTEICRGGTSECVNGRCVAPISCSPSCSGNTTCVQGTCVENYCASGVLTCPSGLNCVKNACQAPVPGGTGNNGGGQTPDGNGGGSSGGVEAEGGGCSGTPGAISLFGILFAVSSMVRLRSKKN